jgi:hypothetical protein
VLLLETDTNHLVRIFDIISSSSYKLSESEMVIFVHRANDIACVGPAWNLLISLSSLYTSSDLLISAIYGCEEVRSLRKWWLHHVPRFKL